MQIIKQPKLYEVVNLLQCNDLPYEDIKNKSLEHFFGYYKDEILEGIVGLEIYNNIALLRSLAVNNQKSTGIGSKLLEYVNNYSKKNNIDTLYLLTTTANKYFLKKGFEIEDKNKAPSIIQNTEEFRSICPSNSIFMKKIL